MVVFVGNVRVRDYWRDTDLRVFTPRNVARYIIAQQPALTQREIKAVGDKFGERDETLSRLRRNVSAFPLTAALFIDENEGQ